jgi:hypothetical protein
MSKEEKKIKKKKKEKRKEKVSSGFGNDLCLDFILSSEHVVNLGQVVSTGEERVGVASRLEVLLQVGVLTQNAHLKIGVSQSEYQERGFNSFLRHHKPEEVGRFWR